MVTLTAGQAIKDTDFVVHTSGDYEDEDLVLCILDSDHDIAVSYQAYYIANGKNKGES